MDRWAHRIRNNPGRRTHSNRRRDKTRDPVQTRTVVKNKEPIVEEVTMVPIPVAVPICIVTFDDTAHSSKRERCLLRSRPLAS